MAYTKEDNSKRFYLKFTNSRSNDIKQDSDGIKYIPNRKLMKSLSMSIKGIKTKRQVTAKFSHIYL